MLHSLVRRSLGLVVFMNCMVLISLVGSVGHICVCRKTRRGAVFYCRGNLRLGIRGIHGRGHFRPQYNASFVVLVVLMDIVVSAVTRVVLPSAICSGRLV